jgi:hypothetical protein
MSNEEIDIIIDEVCEHKIVCNEYFEPNLSTWHVHTPTSEVARYCCIKCIEQVMHFIDNLPEHQRMNFQLSAKKSAKQFLIECISYGPTEFKYRYSVDIKFQAISWFLERGFPRCSQIFEFTFPYSCDQLKILASYGAFPTGLNLLSYERADLWDEIRTIYKNIPDEYLEQNGAISDNELIKRVMYETVIYPHDLPIVTKSSLNDYLIDDCIRLIVEYLPK